jgi:hypothetical protein
MCISTAANVARITSPTNANGFARRFAARI